MAYRGLVWPLRLNSSGDFQSGDIRTVIKSDIRTALQTRRFVDEDLGGERKMRPGAFGQIPFALMETYDRYAMPILVEEYVREALQILVDEGKIYIIQIDVDAQPRGVVVKIGYVVVEEQLRDEYSHEIVTEQPVDSGNARRV